MLEQHLHYVEKQGIGIMYKHRIKNRLIYACVMTTSVLLAACNGGPELTSLAQSSETVQQSLDTSLYQDIFEERINTGQSIGLAVSIVDGDRQRIMTLGLADIEGKVPISEDSLFEIGSITKTFTTLILADSVIKGEVGLDDPVSNYLPDSVKMPMFDGQEITLRNLATHTSSLPSIPDNFNPEDPLNPYANYTPELMYAFLSGYTLEKPVGAEVSYSNLGMGLLGHILQLQTGKSYEELVTDRILAPLNMSDSFVVVPERKKADFATGHDPAGIPTSYWDIPTLAGAGALRSDISDMTRYLEANLGLIETPLADAMSQSHAFQQKLGEDGGYIGLGWFTENMGGEDITWHNGGTGGFRTFLGFDPANKRGVVVLANSWDQSDLIGQAILTNSPEALEPVTEGEGLQFTTDQLDRFVGDYQLAPEFIIGITREDEQLFLQATGQPKVPIFARSETEFYLKVVEASVVFEEDNNGKIFQLILNQGGAMLPARKQ